MKSSFNQRYLISFISKLLYLQWFFGFGGCALRFCVVAAAWVADRCRNAVSDCRKRALGMLPYSIIILLFFQYLLAILTGQLTLCVEKSLWLPLMRGLSAKLTGGEIYRKSDFSVSPSVKIFDFATSLIRGRQGAFLSERHWCKVAFFSQPWYTKPTTRRERGTRYGDQRH